MTTVLDYGEPEIETVEGDTEMELNPQTFTAEIYNEDIDGPDDPDRRAKFYPLPEQKDGAAVQDQQYRAKESDLEKEAKIIGKERE